MALNKWIGLGRITKDPELKTTQGGKLVTNFSIAVNRAYQKGGQQEADFLNVVAWEKKADFIGKYFKKGDPIQIVGRIETRKYQDKDGYNRVAFEIIAEEASFVEGNKRSENTGNSKEDYSVELDDDEDLPF